MIVLSGEQDASHACSRVLPALRLLPGLSAERTALSSCSKLAIGSRRPADTHRLFLSHTLASQKALLVNVASEMFRTRARMQGVSLLLA